MGKIVLIIAFFTAVIINSVFSVSFNKQELASITKETYPDDDAVIQMWECEIKLKNQKNENKELVLSPVVEKRERRVIKILTEKGVEKYSTIRDSIQIPATSREEENDYEFVVFVYKDNGKIVEFKSGEYEKKHNPNNQISFEKTCFIPTLEIGDSIFIETKKYFTAQYVFNDFILSSEHSICHIMFKIIYPLDAEIDMFTFNDLNYKKHLTDKYAIWQLDNIPGIKNELYVLPSDRRVFHIGYGVRRFRWFGYKIAFEIFDEDSRKFLNRREVDFIDNYDEVKTVNDINTLISRTVEFLDIDIGSTAPFTKNKRSSMSAMNSKKMPDNVKLIFIVYKILRKNRINVKIAGLLSNDSKISGNAKHSDDAYRNVILIVDHFSQRLFFSFYPENSFELPFKFSNKKYFYKNSTRDIQISTTPFFNNSSLNISTDYHYCNTTPQKKIMIFTQGSWSQVLDEYLRKSNEKEQSEFDFIPKDAKFTWHTPENNFENKDENIYISGEVVSDYLMDSQENVGKKRFNFDMNFIESILSYVGKKQRYNDFYFYFPSTLRFEQRIQILDSENVLSYPQEAHVFLLKNIECNIITKISENEIRTLCEIKIHDPIIKKDHQQEVSDFFNKLKNILSTPVIIINETTVK